ncbi:glycoside hydrolase family 15 protein [Dictyobacter aurantiacus]|uniref:Glucoamylase n=1 Tax=Dictyobacter aurantiacus TaxID=1936993 RepID=A0A401ZGM0_9CHLR|nr:glycoside hydrolase family 15 protein [Dictyobacter aurantiacus]GCE06031.1 glucoamylase [Dictyobacter aurantiacus]
MSEEQKYLPIEDYALIGNLHTVALVGKNGSIDWCCLPRFDAPSVFGALLDAEKGGFFRIAPTEMSDIRRQQLYLPETNILLTRFLSQEGVAEVTDFMPIKEVGTPTHDHKIIRSVTMVHGSLSFTLMCRPAFNYARDEHRVELSEGGATFLHQDFHLRLSSPIALEQDEQGGVKATFTLHKDETLHFMLESSKDGKQAPQPISEKAYHTAFHQTSHYWQNWLSQCRYQGRWREMVQRSALVLKLLTYAPTGAIVAAATTSLPESIGGERNWDYRYTWIRDASFSLYSLLTLGLTQEAEEFMGWLDDRCHQLNDGGMLQPMYGIDGEQKLTEITLDHLEGYRQSRPVRVGNGAYTQTQLDIYGEMMDAIFIFNNHEAISYDLWLNVRNLLDWLAEHWQEPDEGIWEVRGGPKHFLHSRLMSWVAFDRAIRITRDRGWPAPTEKWVEIRSQIYEQIMNKAWNEKEQSFVQYYGSDAIDASALLLMITNFTGTREPRMLSTIERIKRQLSEGSLVKRYTQGAADDGLEGQEGTFSACSFWLVEDLARAGRLDEARLRLEKLLSYSNHVGLYAEEISPAGVALGNYPQAFTHLALITACYHLDKALNIHLGRAHPSSQNLYD